MKRPVTIIIPTWNNPEFLNPCIDSIEMTGALNGLAELVIVNNGKQDIADYVKGRPGIRVLEPGENLGWEKGLEYGLKHSDSEFVCFQNDDTHIPPACQHFYQHLLYPFANGNVAAVGPSTTVASGWHSIFNKYPLIVPAEVSYLIFFTVMIRRKDLEEAGGIDTTCPGGDDFDLSIRLRKLGKKLVINPSAFLIHHGFKTGTRVKGDRDVSGGWNSQEMIDRTNRWLIQKHGFKTYMQTIRGLQYTNIASFTEDREGQVIRPYVLGEKVIELGCGFRKTVDHAIGVDRTAKGEQSPHLPNQECVADIEADITEPLPFEDFSQDTAIARHILEHCIDSVQTLKNWNRVIKMGGRLIIAVPDQRIASTIPMNPEHVHAFTPESLKSLMELCGYREIVIEDPNNRVSFVGVYEKVLHMAPLEERAACFA